MSRALRVFFLLAGLGDLATGLLLVAAPARTLALMGIHPPPAEPVLLRLVGAFVAGVGGAYLVGFLPPPGHRGNAASGRERAVLAVTALQRALVALFVAAAVASAALPAGWATVAAYDGALTILQLVVLRRPAPTAAGRAAGDPGNAVREARP